MPAKCSVPNCTSNYASNKEGYITVFRFPQDVHLREQWLRSIPRKNWEPSSKAVVCIKHFKEEDISYNDMYKDKNGNEKSFPRIRPVLKENVVPKIFPGLPKYLSEKKFPIQRSNPTERREVVFSRQEEQQDEWLRSDVILNFVSLCENFKCKLSAYLVKWNYHENIDWIYFYLMSFDSDEPDVRCSIKICQSMEIEVRVNHSLIVKDDLKWILSSSAKISRWSQVENIFARYSEPEVINVSIGTILKNIQYNAEKLKYQLIENEESNKIDQIEFLMEQFNLLFSNRNRFSSDLILKSFLLYIQSKKAYNTVRHNKLLILPHQKYLQKICSSLKIAPHSCLQNENYIKTIAERLSELEKYIVLQIDEIYVKPMLDYKNGNLVGFAENDTLCQAGTVQTFLISSIFGNMKEVVSLQPVKNITGEQLHDMVIALCGILIRCGFKIICIVTDNAKVNRSMISKLTDNSTDKYYFHLSPEYPTFVMFDTVHILKNIRNNWLNLKNATQTFVFPDFDHPAQIKKANFVDIRYFFYK